MKPLIVHSSLTGRWYVTTRYKILDSNGHVQAVLKYDVTDQIKDILADKDRIMAETHDIVEVKQQK